MPWEREAWVAEWGLSWRVEAGQASERKNGEQREAGRVRVIAAVSRQHAQQRAEPGQGQQRAFWWSWRRE